MKLLRNLVIAASAFALFSGVSALAADDFSLDAYDATNNAISVADGSIAGLQQAAGDQMVVAVVPAGQTAISESNLVYINTDASASAGTLLKNMLLKDGIADGNYEVWVGGTSGQKKIAGFTVGSTKTHYYGDVNGDEQCDIADVGEVMKYINWDETSLIVEGTWTFTAANVDKTGDIDVSDAGEFMKYINWEDSLITEPLTPFTE